MARLNEAYETLSNTEKRADYDRMRAAQDPARAADAYPETRGAAAGVIPGQGLDVCIFCKHSHSAAARLEDGAVCAHCRSPLLLNRPALTGDSDRRAIMRLSKQLPLAVYTAWPQQPVAGQSGDVSLNGMQVRVEIELKPGQLIKLDSRILSAVARVSHSRREGSSWVAGVEFLRLNFVDTRGSFVAEQA